ncbi:hypothetical protein FPQ18DRAFT_417235 [Pyronema domesticum]|nr:hypothetical protein FPQ18DRAFT_417235 [Pyronema domesticum]
MYLPHITNPPHTSHRSNQTLPRSDYYDFFEPVSSGYAHYSQWPQVMSMRGGEISIEPYHSPPPAYKASRTPSSSSEKSSKSRKSRKSQRSQRSPPPKYRSRSNSPREEWGYEKDMYDYAKERSSSRSEKKHRLERRGSIPAFEVATMMKQKEREQRKKSGFWRALAGCCFGGKEEYEGVSGYQSSRSSSRGEKRESKNGEKMKKRKAMMGILGNTTNPFESGNYMAVSRTSLTS